MAGVAPVGGRLEAAPPKPVTNPGDRWRLIVLLLAAAAVHALVVSRTAMTARDGLGFARTALQLAHPSVLGDKATAFDVLRNTQHPPGYPAALLAASLVTPGESTQDRMLFAGQLVSAVAGTLLVLPLYWLGRTLFGQGVGFAGALLFTCLPVAARYTSDAVTEGLYLLLVCTAVLLGTRAVRKPGLGGFLLCGMACGAAYMVRPEGALSAAAVGLVAVGLAITRREPVAATAGRLAFLTVGFLIVSGWYMAVIGGLTNKPSGNKLFEMFNLRQAMQPQPQGAVAGGPALFAASLGGRSAMVLAELAKEGFKSFHYLPPVFALIGVALAIRRRCTDPYLLVPLAFVGLMLPVLVLLGFKADYVSERHTLSTVMVLCPFAVAGFLWLGDQLGHRWLGWLLLAATILSTGPGLTKPLHRDRLGHKVVGEILAREMKPGDVLIDPFDWAGFYSGHTLKTIPPDPPDPLPPGSSRWVVMEPKEKDKDLKLPRFSAAMNVLNDGANRASVVYHWPEGPLEDAKVVLYRQVVQKPAP